MKCTEAISLACVTSVGAQWGELLVGGHGLIILVHGKRIQ
jgi:hypothetical protein